MSLKVYVMTYKGDRHWNYTTHMAILANNRHEAWCLTPGPVTDWDFEEVDMEGASQVLASEWRGDPG